MSSQSLILPRLSFDDRALDPRRVLLHPAWLAGVALLAVNDHLLKGSGLLPGLVTGKLYVDLGFHPGAPLLLKGLDPEVPEIPAVPTQLEEVQRTIRGVVERLQKMPLEDIVQNLDSAIASASL